MQEHSASMKKAFPEAETEKNTAQSRPSRGAQCVLPSSSGILDFCKEPHESLLCSPQLTVWREPGPADRQQVLSSPRPGACCHTSLSLLHVFHATNKQPPLTLLEGSQTIKSLVGGGREREKECICEKQLQICSAENYNLEV